MSLTDQLNRKFRLPFQDYTGPIPKTVPALRLDDRIFAGGDIILNNRLAALTPDEQGATDQESIDGWGQYFDLADLCATFEDFVKLQPDSGFLTGIRGIVEKDGQTYVAVDADAVKAAIAQDKEEHFANQLSQSETVYYQTREGAAKQAQVQNVILFPYDGRSIGFTADQFSSIDTKAMKRQNVINGRDMEPDEIVRGDRVIHPAWKIYPVETIIPLVERQQRFTFNGQNYNFDTLMGFYLPDVPSGNGAEGRALYVCGLYSGSRLYINCDLGDDSRRVIGVDKKIRRERPTTH